MLCPSKLLTYSCQAKLMQALQGNTLRALFCTGTIIFNSSQKNKVVIWQEPGLEFDIENLGACSSSENNNYNHDEQDNPKYHQQQTDQRRTGFLGLRSLGKLVTSLRSCSMRTLNV
uniref:Uncharacterized protein n=1 Tax=Opuntia streptacantha TaxID=393608 RepID=A0A7C8ZHL8_OPUST